MPGLHKCIRVRCYDAKLRKLSPHLPAVLNETYGQLKTGYVLLPGLYEDLRECVFPDKQPAVPRQAAGYEKPFGCSPVSA